MRPGGRGDAKSPVPTEEGRAGACRRRETTTTTMLSASRPPSPRSRGAAKLLRAGRESRGPVASRGRVRCAAGRADRLRGGRWTQGRCLALAPPVRPPLSLPP